MHNQPRGGIELLFNKNMVEGDTEKKPTGRNKKLIGPRLKSQRKE